MAFCESNRRYYNCNLSHCDLDIGACESDPALDQKCGCPNVKLVVAGENGVVPYDAYPFHASFEEALQSRTADLDEEWNGVRSRVEAHGSRRSTEARNHLNQQRTALINHINRRVNFGGTFALHNNRTGCRALVTRNGGDLSMLENRHGAGGSNCRGDNNVHQFRWVVHRP